MKVLSDKKEYDMLWDWIYSDFKFRPSTKNGTQAFSFDGPYLAYKLNSVWDSEQKTS